MKALVLTIFATSLIATGAFSQGAARSSRGATAEPVRDRTVAPAATSRSAVTNGARALRGNSVTAPASRSAVTIPSVGGTVSSGAVVVDRDVEQEIENPETDSISLSARESAALAANLGSASSEALDRLRDSHFALLNVADQNADKEEALSDFLANDVSNWTCGDACVNRVADVMDVGSGAIVEAKQSNAVAVADVGYGFGAGLKSFGILEKFNKSCPIGQKIFN